MFGSGLKDYLKAGRAELAIEAASWVILGLTYMEVLPPVEKIGAMLASIFFATLGVYAFNHVTDCCEDAVNKPKSAVISGRKTGRQILIFSLACKLAAIASAWLISWAVLAVVGIIILGSFLYSCKSVCGGRLKDIFIVKNATIALLWALVPLLPMLAWGFSVPSAYLAVLLFVFISSFICTVVSDLKDVEGDAHAGIKTYPTVHGRKNTLALLVALNTIGLLTLAAGWMFLGLKPYLFLLPLMGMARYYEFWLIGSGKKPAAYVYSKIDCPTETALGALALIGRLLIH